MAAGLFSIASLVASLASSAYGAIKSGKEQRDKEAQIGEMLEEERQMYLEDRYQNSLESPTSKAYLKRIDRDARDQMESIEAQADKSGATQENVIASKESVNKAKSDAVNNVAINDQQTQLNAKNAYLGRKSSLEGAQLGAYDARSQNWQNLGSGISQSIGTLGSLYADGTFESNLKRK